MKLWISTLSCALIGLIGLAGCGDEETNTQDLTQTERPLEVVCVDDTAALQSEGDVWVCGETRVIECSADRTSGGEIYVLDERANACQDELVVSDAGPYPVGEWDIQVYNNTVLVCEAELVVVDTQPPVAEELSATIWPPNHKMVEFGTEDCVRVEDPCDDDVDVQFTWATSDEAPDAKGDGNTSVDIELEDDVVRLRAERQGGGDGRVYTLGWKAQDDSGNTVEGTCQISVPHDQGQGDVAVDSGVVVRVDIQN